MKVVIMAGGKGSRIASVASDIPKPMITICGKPILEYQIECLEKNNLTDIILVVGHLGHVIKDYFDDGKRFNCAIQYYTEDNPLGTAGALYKIQNDLSEDFLLINGDIIFDVDFSRFIEFHRQKKAFASLAVHPNSHPYDSALLQSDENDRVVQWLNKEDTRLYYKNQVNAGIHILSKKLLNAVHPATEKIDLDRDILKPAVAEGKIYAYRTPEYIKDMGTPDRYRQVEKDINEGFVKRRNLSNKQRAVFLDRDGTINKPCGFITRPEQFVLNESAAHAVKKINETGFLAIVITNQPVIARGDCSVEELGEIHQKMESDLGAQGAYLDDIFYCPHHPDKGFAGERAEYKIECDCRKPKPGMILAAAKKYNIDLAASFMIGDDTKDARAGIAAGCAAALIRARPQDPTEPIDGKEVPVFPGLLEAVFHITASL
jgi:D,D-heptose 1,7-bisphosphate phosphatase